MRLDSTAKDRDKWKVKSLSNSSEEEEMLRVSLMSKKDPHSTLVLFSNYYIRVWQLVLSVRRTSKTRFYVHVDIYSAEDVSKTDFLTE